MDKHGAPLGCISKIYEVYRKSKSAPLRTALTKGKPDFNHKDRWQTRFLMVAWDLLRPSPKSLVCDYKEKYNALCDYNSEETL